eukprot:SAG25_NODE_326_length_9730_cov_8.520195_12_plen_44_part_00
MMVTDTMDTKRGRCVASCRVHTHLSVVSTFSVSSQVSAFMIVV